MGLLGHARIRGGSRMRQRPEIVIPQAMVKDAFLWAKRTEINNRYTLPGGISVYEKFLGRLSETAVAVFFGLPLRDSCEHWDQIIGQYRIDAKGSLFGDKLIWPLTKTEDYDGREF